MRAFCNKACSSLALIAVEQCEADNLLPQRVHKKGYTPFWCKTAGKTQGVGVSGHVVDFGWLNNLRKEQCVVLYFTNAGFLI